VIEATIDHDLEPLSRAMKSEVAGWSGHDEGQG
jgi:hypothetical protein